LKEARKWDKLSLEEQKDIQKAKEKSQLNHSLNQNQLVQI
jgi:hypothetical protein